MTLQEYCEIHRDVEEDLRKFSELCTEADLNQVLGNSTIDFEGFDRLFQITYWLNLICLNMQIFMDHSEFYEEVYLQAESLPTDAYLEKVEGWKKQFIEGIENQERKEIHLFWYQYCQ